MEWLKNDDKIWYIELLFDLLKVKNEIECVINEFCGVESRVFICD